MMFEISRTNGIPIRLCKWAIIACLAISAATIHAAEPKKVALLVGVNKYLKAGLRNLDFPEADVEAVGAELKKLGFQVAILKGSSTGNKQATRENIEAMAQAMVKPLGKDDLMLVMLSGHGMQLEVTDADKKKRDDGFYCPVEAVPNNPATLFSLSHLTDEILALNVGKKLVLIDACRDVPKDPGRGAKGIQGKVIALPEDTAILFGCRAGQQSYENDELGHGLFTHCLLEGLQGQAAKGGRLTWSGLSSYVEDRLSDDDMKARMPKDRPQEPIAAGGVGQLVLARVDIRPLPDPPKFELPWPPIGPDKTGEVVTNSLGLKLALIPAGKFTMGSPANETGHVGEENQVEVTLTKPFYLGTTTVTQGQWKQLMKTEPWKEKEYVKEGANYPATYVNWDDAQAFCKALSEKEGKKYRLPTEAEWEYACRAGTTTSYSFGDDASSLSEFARLSKSDLRFAGDESRLGAYSWFDKNAFHIGEKYAHEVSQKKPNANGLYDMHGNVWQWCEDSYSEKLPGGSDPLVSTLGDLHIFRGGSWIGDAERCRSAHRFWRTTGDRAHDVGFRLALVPSS